MIHAIMLWVYTNDGTEHMPSNDIDLSHYKLPSLYQLKTMIRPTLKHNTSTVSSTSSTFSDHLMRDLWHYGTRPGRIALHHTLLHYRSSSMMHFQPTLTQPKINKPISEPVSNGCGRWCGSLVFKMVVSAQHQMILA